MGRRRCCCVPKVGSHSLASSAARPRLLSNPTPGPAVERLLTHTANGERRLNGRVKLCSASLPVDLSLSRVEPLGRVGKDAADSLLIAKRGINYPRAEGSVIGFSASSGERQGTKGSSVSAKDRSAWDRRLLWNVCKDRDLETEIWLEGAQGWEWGWE